MEFVKWASSVLDEVDSKAAETVQKIQPNQTQNKTEHNNHTNNNQYNNFTQSQSISHEAAAESSSASSYDSSAASASAAAAASDDPLSVQISIPSNTEIPSTGSSLASFQALAGNSTDSSNSTSSSSSNLNSNPADEIASLRAVWNSTRSQLSRARHLLSTSEENFKAKIQTMEINQLEQIDRIRQEYEQKLSDARLLIAANQAEFETAIMSKNQFHSANDRKTKELEELIASLESANRVSQLQIAELSSERDRLISSHDSLLKSHREQFERLRFEEGKRLNEVEAELRGRIESLSAAQLGAGGGDDDSASLQRSIDELTRLNDRSSAENRWIAAELQNSREQMKANKERAEIEQKELNSQINSLKSRLSALQHRADEFASDIRIQTSLVESLRLEKTELEFQLSTEKNRNRLDRTAELELRMKALADKLIEKTASMESASAERAALRLKLEQNEIKLQVNENYLRNIREKAIARGQIELEEEIEEGLNARGKLRGNGSNSDSASQFQSPAVKRAVRFFEGIGVQVALLLRRYPQARIGFGLYVILLHLWVIFVFSHFLGHTNSAKNNTLTLTNSQFKAP